MPRAIASAPSEAGRNIGIRPVDIIEIKESRAQDAERRMLEESIALANVIPEGAATVILDERGEAGSAAFAGAAARWRDGGPAGGGFRRSAAPTAWRRACATRPSLH